MTASCALEVEGLSKSYGEVRAVENFHARVPVGTVLGFLGPNGAGKTTVIRMLSTILRPDAGSFTVGGVPSTQPAEIRRRIGVLPESAGYPRGQTGEEWLTFHCQLFGQTRHQARVTVRRLLAEVGLDDRGHSPVATYSRGMRQRLGTVYVDPEDWSSQRTVYLDPIPAHDSVRVPWKVQAVNEGRFVLYVAVTTRTGPAPVAVSDGLRLSSAGARTIGSVGVLPVALGVPGTLALLLVLNAARRRRTTRARTPS